MTWESRHGNPGAIFKSWLILMEIQIDSNNLMQALFAMDCERIKAKLNAGADVNFPYD